MMGLKNCRNIIISLISNRHFSLHSVSFLYVEDKSKTINTVSKYYILISNSNTSRNWGGEQEQEQELEKGNVDARNWQEEAQKVVKRVVRFSLFLILVTTNYYLNCE